MTCTQELQQQITDLFAAFELQTPSGPVSTEYEIDLDDELRVRFKALDDEQFMLSIVLPDRADALDPLQLSTLLVLNQAGDISPTISASIDPTLNSVVLWTRCEGNTLRTSGLLPVFHRLVLRADGVSKLLRIGSASAVQPF